MREREEEKGKKKKNGFAGFPRKIKEKIAKKRPRLSDRLRETGEGGTGGELKGRKSRAPFRDETEPGGGPLNERSAYSARRFESNRQWMASSDAARQTGVVGIEQMTINGMTRHRRRFQFIPWRQSRSTMSARPLPPSCEPPDKISKIHRPPPEKSTLTRLILPCECTTRRGWNDGLDVELETNGKETAFERSPPLPRLRYSFKFTSRKSNREREYNDRGTVSPLDNRETGTSDEILTHDKITN